MVVSAAQVPIGGSNAGSGRGCRHEHADPSRARRARVAIAADPGRVAVTAVATVPETSARSPVNKPPLRSRRASRRWNSGTRVARERVVGVKPEMLVAESEQGSRPTRLPLESSVRNGVLRLDVQHKRRDPLR